MTAERVMLMSFFSLLPIDEIHQVQAIKDQLDCARHEIQQLDNQNSDLRSQLLATRLQIKQQSEDYALLQQQNDELLRQNKQLMERIATQEDNARLEFEDQKAAFIERETRVADTLKNQKETREAVERIYNEVAASVALLRSLSELSPSLRRVADETSSLRKQVNGSMFKGGMLQLAKLYRTVEHAHTPNEQYIENRLRIIMQQEFGMEQLKPAPRSPYDSERYEPKQIRAGMNPQVVTGCAACGWAFENELLLRAVVETED